MLGAAEEAAAGDVIRSGLLAQGPQCAALEDELADYLSTRHVVVVSSGSAALHLSLVALGICKDDSVGLPSYVCAALLNAVRHVRASPYLIDLPESGYNICPTTEPQDLSAVIVPHMFGKAAAVDTYTAPVIEDCAMAIGASAAGRKLGTAGKLGVFSFYATKVLCAGEGGAVCTDDANLADIVRDLRDYDGRIDDKPRYNYKMTDIQAAVARCQLKSLDRFITMRRHTADRYGRALRETRACLPEFGEEDIPFRYVVRHPENDADTLIASFDREDVAARKPVFRPLHEYLETDLTYENTSRAHTQAVSIPLYPSLTETEIDLVIEAGLKALR